MIFDFVGTYSIIGPRLQMERRSMEEECDDLVVFPSVCLQLNVSQGQPTLAAFYFKD